MEAPSELSDIGNTALGQSTPSDTAQHCTRWQPSHFSENPRRSSIETLQDTIKCATVGDSKFNCYGRRTRRRANRIRLTKLSTVR
jgi:hypothetical protein